MKHALKLYFALRKTWILSTLAVIVVGTLGWSIYEAQSWHRTSEALTQTVSERDYLTAVETLDQFEDNELLISWDGSIGRINRDYPGLSLSNEVLDTVDTVMATLGDQYVEDEYASSVLLPVSQYRNKLPDSYAAYRQQVLNLYPTHTDVTYNADMVYTSNTDHNINIIQPLKDNRGFNTVAQTQIAYFGIWAFVLWFVLLTVLVIILDQTQHKNDFLLARVKQRKDILFAKYTWLVVVPTLALLIAAGFQWFVRYWTIGADYLVIPDARYMLLSFLAAVITFVFLNIYVVTVDTFIGQVLAKPIVMIAGIFASGMLFTELNAYFEWQLTSDTHYWWPLLQVGMGIVLCLFSFWLNQRSSLEQINQVVRLPQLRVPFFWFVTTLAIIVFPGSQFLASKTHDTAIGSDALLLTSVYAAIVIGLSIVFILNKKPRRFWLKAE